MDEFDEVLEALFDCFSQACHESVLDKTGDYVRSEYDHGCLSAYEHAQDVLIKYGKIKKEECRRT